MSTEKKKRRLSPGMTLVWGGFNAGAVLGVFDALMIMLLGLASFDAALSVVGLFVVDAFGMAVLGVIAVLLAKMSGMIFPAIHGRRMLTLGGGILVVSYLAFFFLNFHWVFLPIQGQAAPNSPNLVLITLDTLRADSVGFGGHPLVRTPFLDRLALRSLQYANAVCPVPMTTPSHASMLTGTIPAIHGAKENRYRLGEDNDTLPEYLRRNGYRTAAFVSCFPLDRRFGLNQGFMLYQDHFGVPGDLRQASWLKSLLTLKNNHLREQSARFTNSLAVPWIRRYASENPFFLWVHYFDPHAPYTPGRIERLYYKNQVQDSIPFADDDDHQRALSAVVSTGVPPEPGRPEELYLGEISETDRAVARLFDELARKKVLDNTYVVVVADHGESLGEHGLFYTHGEDIYEPAVSVPFLLWGNALSDARLDPRLASVSDIPSTLVPLTGIATPFPSQGVDLRSQSKRRTFEILENFGIILAPNAVKQRGFRSMRWKLIASGSELNQDNDLELYDLNVDPAERINRTQEHAEFAQETHGFIADTFRRAEEEQISATIDESEETMKKLRALGYFQ